MQRTLKAALGMALCLLGVACNANSDAVHVLETENTSLRATMASYESIGATVTAQATSITSRLSTVTSDLATARGQVRDLTARINAGAAAPTTVSAAALNTTPGAQDSASADFAFAKIVTARGKDASGCAVNESNSFLPTEPAIWVVADVRNFKKGTKFVVKWAGDSFTHENDWTATMDGAQICVHFYIVPTTLGLQPGTYSVTVTAGNLSPQPIQFTVQGASAGAAATATKAQ